MSDQKPLGRRVGMIGGDRVVLKSRNQAPNFAPGDMVAASWRSDGLALRTGTAKVTEANRDDGTLTLDDVSQIIGFCDGDYLFYADDPDREQHTARIHVGSGESERQNPTERAALKQLEKQCREIDVVTDIADPKGESAGFEVATSNPRRSDADMEQRCQAVSAIAGREVSPYEDWDTAMREARPIFDRPPREVYVRCSIEFGGFTYEPAVEWRQGDGFYEMTSALETLAKASEWANDPPDPMARAILIGKSIAIRWPDRAYFVEVWQEGRKGFAQVFQPFGVPRNRP